MRFFPKVIPIDIVFRSCNIIFSNDLTDGCISCGGENIRNADDYEIADFIGSIFLDKDEVNSICESEKK